MLGLGRLLLAASLLLCALPPALAQSIQTGLTGIYSAWTGARGPDLALTTTSGSTATALGAGVRGQVARVCNIGAQTAYARLGASTVTVTSANGTIIPAGACISMNAAGATSVIGITASGTTTLQIEVGTGNDMGFGNGGAGANGGVVTTNTFAAYPVSSITRSANTVTYTANTGWNNGTPTFFSFTVACRANGTQVYLPQIDIWSSANPTLKLQGILWLFSAVPGTNVGDNANFNIASADYANLLKFDGIPFTLTNNQGSGASNSGVSLAGTVYQVRCAGGTTTITGMVEVVNAYVPASAEVLHVGLPTTGVN